MRVTFEYDGQGRMIAWSWDDDWGVPHTVESEWDGPCKLHEYVVMANGEAWNEDWACDEHGWPVSSHRAPTQSGPQFEPIDTTWTNTYDDDLLVKTVVSTGFTYDYQWTDGRLTREEVTQTGDPMVLTYAYEDGWIREITQSNSPTTTYTYEDGRLVSSGNGTVHTEWVYADGNRPTRRLYYDENGTEQPTELTFTCP